VGWYVLRLISLSHYDVTSKQTYCLNAQNHCRPRGYSKSELMKNRLKDYIYNEETNNTFKDKAQCAR